MTDHERHVLMDASATMKLCDWPDSVMRKQSLELADKLDALLLKEINEPVEYAGEVIPF